MPVVCLPKLARELGPIYEAAPRKLDIVTKLKAMPEFLIDLAPGPKPHRTDYVTYDAHYSDGKSWYRCCYTSPLRYFVSGWEARSRREYGDSLLQILTEKRPDTDWDKPLYTLYLPKTVYVYYADPTDGIHYRFPEIVAREIHLS